MQVPHCLDYCSFVEVLKVEGVGPPTLLFFIKIALVTLGPLNFHMSFSFSLLMFAEKPLGFSPASQISVCGDKTAAQTVRCHQSGKES